MVRLADRAQWRNAAKMVFQFQYGTISGRVSLGLARSGISFQFQYGTISGTKLKNYFWFASGFNSSMVRLAANGSVLPVQLYQCFNSSMVRLADNTVTRLPVGTEFQFQYGTISGCIDHPSFPRDHQFQFQYGTISGGLAAGFDSLKAEFQFQYGTISGWNSRNGSGEIL